MNGYISALLFASALGSSAWAASANAGTVAGGGGKGVVCRNADGSIRSAELLDLWEAREIYGLKAKQSDDTLEHQVRDAALALGKSIPSDHINLRYGTNEHMKPYEGPAAVSLLIRLNALIFLQPESKPIRRLHGVKLAPTNDSLESVTPADCEIEQIVRYTDQSRGHGSVLANQDIIDHLDSVNHAALIAHEAMYKLFRDNYSEPNSLRIRRAIGLAFSGHQFQSLNRAELPDEYFECTDGNTAAPSKLFVFRLKRNPEWKKDTIIFQPSVMAGMPLIDSPILTELPEDGAILVKSLKGLFRERNGEFTAHTAGIVQSELRPRVKFERSASRKTKLTLSALPSVIQPEGMAPRELHCEYHGK